MHEAVYKHKISGFVAKIIFIISTVVITSGCQSHFLSKDGGQPDLNLYENADLLLGARLYDNWLTHTSSALLFIGGGLKPMFTKNPGYPVSNKGGSSSDSWRCKGCHGWDYSGKTFPPNELRASTKINGLQEAKNKNITEIFWKIAKGQDGHAFGKYLNQMEIWALTRFVREGVFDTTTVINSEGIFKGDLENGQMLYTQNCLRCHGVDGNTIDLRSKLGVQGLAWRANGNPAITLHRVNWGRKDKISKKRMFKGMPTAFVDLNLNREQVVDVLAYTQTLSKGPLLPKGTLNAKQVIKLFSGKTVTSVTAKRKRRSISYYNSNGELQQLRNAITRKGIWRVKKNGRICLQMENLPEKCRIIVHENGTYKKYILKKSGEHQHSVTYKTFREGNMLGQ